MAAKNLFRLLLGASAVTAAAISNELMLRSESPSIDQCPGYCATNVQKHGSQIVAADLSLDGSPCNVYGSDLTNLKLEVEYQTNERLHVKIYDAAQQVYQVPQSVLPRPPNNGANNSDLAFSMIEQPFSFAVSRKSNGQVLFNSTAASFIFESQYVRLRTSLPNSPSLYGLGEHSDNFMLNTTNYTRTLWSRDAGNIPPGTNLYGNHPIYFDHRGANGTHGVFLLNSNGMDVKINNTAEDGQYLEYNLIGGVIDLYFLSGPTPQDVAAQYSEIVGLPAMQSYWGLGFHQCRYGMQDVYEVAAVVANYSAANIPLETMWTDIDYMDARKVFTLDPLRFPLNLMQQLVDYLHSHQQHYVVMVDPAVAYQDYPPFNNGVNDSAFLTVSNGSVYKGVVWPGVTAFPDWFAPDTQDYWNGEFSTFFNPQSGVDIDALWIDMNEASNFCIYPCNNPEAFAKQNGDPPLPPAVRLGPPYAIPGFPADFQPQCVAQVQFNVNATTYYGENIAVIGNVSSLGDGVVSNSAPLNANNYPIWMGLIDLPVNTTVSYQYVRLEEGGSYIYEASNRTLVTGDCDGTVQVITDQITTPEGTPPSTRRLARRSTQGDTTFDRRQLMQRQAAGNMSGLPGRNLIDPPYAIQNAAGSLSNLTLNTDLIHHNGLAMYDTHNMYGTMMSTASRFAMLNRRPSVRPLVITRSTFAGAGAHVGHWLGDNFSDWAHYLISIGQLLQFASLYQVPMVGSDVCGFNGNTNVNLCSRWATLGAFSPFYRNHDSNDAIPQEFYRWPQVAEAARNAISTRYQLLDYIYTAMYRQSTTGIPLLNPMFFAYPNDTNTFSLQYQYLYGDNILVAPVTEENSTIGTVYLPHDTWYDFYTHSAIHSNGSWITLPNVPFTTIPLFIRGGSIIPLRNESANTTTQLRTKDFSLLIAPGLDGNAKGSLYLDDGASLVQNGTSSIEFAFVNGTFSIRGSFGYDVGDVGVTEVVVLGRGNGTTAGAGAGKKREVVREKIPLTGEYTAVLR